MKSNKRFILVTGSPRSATTAVGAVLASGAGVRSLHEPLNQHVGLRCITQYFQYTDQTCINDTGFERISSDILSLNLCYKSGVFPKDQGFSKSLKKILGGRALNSYRLCKYSPNVNNVVWKDPFAVFCSSTISVSLSIPVVYTIRNPWAVAASFKRMAWGFDLNGIIKNTDRNFVPDILASDPPERLDSVKNAAWLWHMIYSYVYQQSTSSCGKMCFVNTDTIIRDPVRTYKSIFEAVGLQFTRKNKRYIQSVYNYRGKKIRPLSPRAHDSNRDLSIANEYWRSILTQADVEYVSKVNGLLWTKLQGVPGLI